MKPLKIAVFLVVLFCSVQLSASEAEPDTDANAKEQLADAEQRADRWRTAFYVSTAVYVFVYIMGRRRLMRKIWARNKALRLALDKAQESDRLKTAFMRNMSHEIRTPLNAINGFSQLLCSPDFELSKEERQDLMRRISKSSKTITNIVSEVLDMSEGESQHDRIEVAINALCGEVLDDLKQMNDKGLDIRYNTSLADDFTVMTNPLNLRRILRRVLDNALKFTERGSIVLSSETIGSHLVVSVADTGIGVAPDNRERIFENFVKLDEYVEGVGLGLSLSRRLARELGGDVIYDQSYIGGARFLITLPLSA